MVNKQYKVFIATSSFGSTSKLPLKLLKDKNLEIIFNPLSRKLTSSELIQFANDVDCIIAGTEEYSKQTLSKLVNLKVISRLGVGIDNIDLNYLDERKIKLYRTSSSPSLAVSELALGLMIALSRNICNNNNLVKNMTWKKSMGHLLSEKTLGIIGLGEIGKNLIKITKGFRFKYLAFDNYKDYTFSKKNNITYCSLDTLLKKSDIISIHLSLNSKTNKIIDYNKLLLLKKNAILINTSRGQVIDEDALYKILIKNKLLKVGLDVFENEPYKGNLSKLDNVILTPHIGSYAKETRTDMEIETSKNLIKGLYEK